MGFGAFLRKSPGLLHGSCVFTCQVVPLLLKCLLVCPVKHALCPLTPEPSTCLQCMCGAQRCFPTGSQEVPCVPAALAGSWLRSCRQSMWGIVPQNTWACSWGGCRAVSARPGAAELCPWVHWSSCWLCPSQVLPWLCSASGWAWPSLLRSTRVPGVPGIH